jgi:formimidoylglutamate deiminase
VAATPALPAVGELLWQQALRGGAAAAGRAVGALAPGRRADLLVLDSNHPSLACVTPGQVLGTLVFCGNDNLVQHVMAGGRWVVRDGRHRDQDAIARRYRLTLAQLRTLQP